jgi:AraC-like DNA-binding protein
MKPQLLKIAFQPSQSFSVRNDSVPYFFNALHFHPEIELVHIEEGSGTQYVGNHLQLFKSGDMVLTGSNLPHLWKCDDVYFLPQSTLRAKATVIHFLPEAFGLDFFEMPEHKIIKQLFQKAKLGLTIEGETKIIIANLMQELVALRGSTSIISLLQILDVLSKSKDCIALNGEDSLILQSEKESERMNNILHYLFENFSKPITLECISKEAKLSPNAFCRYFKQRTNKTFGAFLTELRINYACKLIVETDKAIGDVCYDSGFNNFSNFNRYFKELKGIPPLEFRKKYMQL